MCRYVIMAIIRYTVYIVCVVALYNMSEECTDGMFLLIINTRFDIVTV